MLQGFFLLRGLFRVPVKPTTERFFVVLEQGRGNISVFRVDIVVIQQLTQHLRLALQIGKILAEEGAVVVRNAYDTFYGVGFDKWLRDGLGLIKQSSEIEALASQVPDNGGVYLVPALTGLGAPYWDPYAKGTITGITRGTTAAHIARAALEGIAFETMDVVDAMRRDAGVSLRSLKVDGGASRNNLMMQFQADILGTDVVRPVVTETTALGASYLAGLAVGFWGSISELKAQWQAERVFTPAATPESVSGAVSGWKEAISRTLTK